MTPRGNGSRLREWRSSRSLDVSRVRTILEGLEFIRVLLDESEELADRLPFAESVHATFELRQIRKDVASSRTRLAELELELLERGE